MHDAAPPPVLRGSEPPGPLPRVFGRYVLFDRIGRGGMADIYLARADTALGGSRLCVVKQILPDLGRDPGFERLLVQEAKLAARLTHANIVQVFDLGRESDRLYIGMEYVEGFDLNQLLRELSAARVPLPSEFALLIVREVLRALDYAHRSREPGGPVVGVVHRDVSPSNVLISFEGEVKLCDFGIARAMWAQEPDLGASAPRVVGKSAYMAPEHARGEYIDLRSDVFAAGILLWELCAGRRLYRGSEAEMLALAKRAEIPPLPERGLPAQHLLQAILDRALAPQREARFQSAVDLLHALEAYTVSTKLLASQLRFGTFLSDHFGQEILELRRARELAARKLPSEIPPAVRPAADLYGDDEDEATVVQRVAPSDEESTPVHDEPAFSDIARSVSQSLDSGDRGWTEPGATPVPLRTLGSSQIQLNEPGSPRRWRVPGPARQASEIELDQSLMGLDVLAAAAVEESLTPTIALAVGESSRPTPAPLVPSTVPPPAPLSEPEWPWYTAAAFILAAGVVVYFWP